MANEYQEVEEWVDTCSDRINECAREEFRRLVQRDISELLF